MSSHCIRLCFVEHQAYPIIEPAAAGPVGGRELRAWLFARELARRPDFQVSFVVRPPEKLRQNRYCGVEIIPRVDRLLELETTLKDAVRVSRKFPWLEISRWRWSLLWKLPELVWRKAVRQASPGPRMTDPFLTRIAADVFCCFGVHRDSAAVVASAKAAGRKSVLLLASDSDLNERYGPDSDYVSTYGERGDVCWFVLQQADRIIAQTKWQQKTLWERFGREAVVIANPFDEPAWTAALHAGSGEPASPGLERYVLWVGRADDVHKRPHLCIALAQLCPDVRFLMVLNPRIPEVERRVRAEQPQNVQIVPSVPFAQMPRLFRSAAAFVSTASAEYEGLPNTFLQAAASQVPIASLEVDAGFVTAEQCGEVAGGDLHRLGSYLRRVWNDPALAREQGSRGREYVLRHHAADRKAAELAAVLEDVCPRELRTGATAPAR